ncbi:MAG: hypothetical protein GY895_21150 [Phycisphaera sp.]|nr:hypothetical protein [Phycisphaera sp.]
MQARRGISSIKLLVSLPAILAFAWLGIEFGLVLRAVQQAKIAADSAALAAAARLDADFEVYTAAAMMAANANQGSGQTLAIEIARANAGGDLLLGQWDSETRTFTPDPLAVDAVSVTVRVGPGTPNPSPGFILPNLFELTEATFQRTGIATWNPLPASSSLLVLDDTTERAIDLSNRSTLDSYGDIEVASTNDNAVRVRDQASLIAPTLRVAGGLQGSSEDLIVGNIELDAGILADPYATIPVPSDLEVADSPSLPDTGEIVALEPGRHPNGIVLDQGTLRLLPGLHQFEGVGLQINDTGRVELVDATIQLIGSGTLDLEGQGQLFGTPAFGGNWDDVFLIAPDADAVKVIGDATMILPGILYAPEAACRFEDDSSVVLDGAIARKWILRQRSTVQLDRIIIVAPIESAARARLRK